MESKDINCMPARNCNKSEPGGEEMKLKEITSISAGMLQCFLSQAILIVHVQTTNQSL